MSLSVSKRVNIFCGLLQIIENEVEFIPPTATPIPLLSVNVNATVVHAVAQVEVTQVYANKEEQSIEAIYYFPMNPDGAVTHFQAELEGRVIKGVVKSHEEAEKDYDDAVAKGTTSFLGEETKADIFKIRVGYLKPGTQVKVIIQYVTEVKNEIGTNAIRFYIPTTIAPRYVSPSETDDNKAKDIQDMDFSLSSPAPLSLKVTVYLQGGIKSIESPTHYVEVNDTGRIPANELWHKAIVELSAQTSDMDRDFVLTIVPEEMHKPRLYSEKRENGSTAIMVHLIPNFELDEQKTELIFVLDRSGSMMGNSIELARRALLLFLHSMPADCYFNVVGFGSRYQFLFPNSVKYDNESLKNAVNYTNALEADLGGTEILDPLREIYEKSGTEGYLRQIFILTDGEVSNTDKVLGIVQANASNTRVFALGIGDAASHHLVEGLAKAGGGTSAFVTYNESIDKKVLKQLQNGLQPSLTDVEFEWEGITSLYDTGKSTSIFNKVTTMLGYTLSNTIDIKQAPKNIPPIYVGSQMLVCALFTDQQPTSLRIKAQSPDGPLTFNVENSEATDVGKMLGQMGVIHRLAAIKVVRELELEVSALYFQNMKDLNEQEKLKNEIVSISCRIGITSKYTSFVAIDVENNKQLSEYRVMETRNVPSQLTDTGYETRSKCQSSRGMDFTTKSKSHFKMIPTISRDFRRVSLVSYKKSPEPYFSSGSKFTGSSASISTSLLLQLISLQSFDGSYTLNEQLAAIFNKSLCEIKEAGTNLKLEDQVFATALAISYFVTKMSTEKDSWELIVKKGRQWLARTLQPQDIDDAIEKAATFLGTY